MSPKVILSIRRGAAIAAVGMVLAACQVNMPKDLKPVSSALKMQMDQLGMSEIAPVFVRIFKEESEFEVWKQRKDGKYALLKTYPICKWSGEIGPKKQEGDRQAPEGFYVVTPAQMNPNSSYYLSFDIGYPNAYDRSLGRTGANLMVHGACSSRGCYSMTDEIAGEIFALARDAFRGGQRAFEVEAFPFRMTPENMARHRDNPNMPFWRMLKDGYDHFEITQRPPKVDVCEKRYVFNADASGGRFAPASACPAYTVPEPIRVALAAKQEADEAAYKVAVARLEAEDARKVAEAQRLEQREMRKLAAAERRGDEPATTATALPMPRTKGTAAATPAKLSLIEEPTGSVEEKKGRFSFLKRLFNRQKPADNSGLANEFDAGPAESAPTGAAVAGTPVPRPRPTLVATKAAPTRQAKPAEAAAPQPVKQAEAQPPAPPPQQAEAAPAPAATTTEPVPPRPATASTRVPTEKASSQTVTPAAVEPEKKKPAPSLPGEDRFDDVFG